ncbi:MAG: S8 family serine peptidase, partial [Clostridiales bacterium]|nr:S8 family serine peptidase [Clostridiales bacterium]
MSNLKNIFKCFLPLTLIITFLFFILPGIIAIATDGGSPISTDTVFSGFNGEEGDDFVVGEVLAPADSWQNAQEIATAYGLELKSYAWGIAVLAAESPMETVSQSSLVRDLLGSTPGGAAIPMLGLNMLYSTYSNDQDSSAYPYIDYAGLDDYSGRRGREEYEKTYLNKDEEKREANRVLEEAERERYKKAFSPELGKEEFAKYSSAQMEWERNRRSSSGMTAWEKYTKASMSGRDIEASGGKGAFPLPAGDAQWHHEVMDSERAWALSTGQGVVVAVIDTGIDLKHPKFSGRIFENSYDSHADRVGITYVQDDEGHGTHVSGIIAASMDGDEDVCGIAPKAGILTIKANIPSAPNFFESVSLYRAINYAAINGADIINMSLGRHYSDGWGADDLEHEIIINAVKNGVTVICAAGNDSNDHAGFPAAYPEAIAVSSLRWGPVFENFHSNYGLEIDISAPGSDIYSTANGGGYMYLSGTSMASPNVAGVAALIKSLNLDYTPEQVRDLLCQSARQAGRLSNDKDIYYGWGIINAYGAALGIDKLYKVRYDFNDGEREAVTVIAVPGSKLIEPTWPERDGYAFSGWFLSGAEDEFDFSIAVEKDLKLDAKWIKIEDGMYILEFPDTIFRREVLRQLNQEDGGQRRDSSFIMDDLDLLAAWEFLYVSNMSIFDMTGLKYLSGLKWLYCSDNYLTALDVSDNTALESLFCSDNQINELDLSNNNKLLYLNCSRNEFTELDLSECTALEVLYSIQNYRLSNLDVSKNINLRELFCLVCQLTELDVSNNINLEVLNCSDNLLTELDITKNTKLGGYNSGYFVYPGLDCSGNQLKTLDVSKNFELNIIICGRNQLTDLDVSKNIALEELFCGYNLLTELDLTKNTGLMHLGCSDNRLTTLDVSQNTKLTHIGCRNNNLTALDVSKNIDLSFINCYNNQLTKLDVSNSTVLEGLNCAGNLLTELYVAYADLSGTMGWWYISGNEIYDSGLQCYDNRLTALDISQNPALKIMDCGFNFLTELDVSVNAGLEWLNCTYNYMETIDNVTGWETVLGLIPNNTFYFNPQCSGDLPTGKDITASFKDPGFLTTVREIIGKPEGPILDYDVARIRELFVDAWNTEHVIYDLSGIEHFGSLTYLSCSSQQLEELDLSNNLALTRLFCNYNQLAKLILSNNKILEYISCSENRLTELDLSNSPLLEYLYCHDNQLTELDLAGNSKLIGFSCGRNLLTKLDVSNNPGLYWILCYNNELKELDLSNNSALIELSCSYNQLAELDLSNNPVLEWLYCYGNRLIALDLSHYKNDLWFYGSWQQPTLTLEWDIENGYYSTAIELNNPIFDDDAIAYEDGILKSSSRRFNGTYFVVETGKDGYIISGNLNLTYKRDYDPDDYIEINEDNFPDPVFREWLLNPWNIYGFGADGVLDPGEIEEITSI